MGHSQSAARLFLAALFLVACTAASSYAKETPYLVITKHTPEECLKALDEFSSKGPDFLGKFYWGCMAGEHTGYAVFDAKDEEAVKSMLPSGQKDVKIQKLNKFTLEQIKAFHEQH